MLIAVISPADSSNYISNLFLAFSVLLSYLLCEIISIPLRLLNSGLCRVIVSAVVFLGCFGLNLVYTPGYLFTGFKDYDNTVNKYYEETCIFCSDSSIPITQSLLQLINFDEVYVFDDSDYEGLVSYLKKHNTEHTVLYINTLHDDFSSEQVADCIIENTDYASREELYSFESYEVYLLSK